MKPLSLSLMIALSASPFVSASTEMIGVEYSGDVYRINAVAGTSTFVGSSGIYQPNSLAMDSNGSVYVGSSGGGIYVISATTGAAKLVANLNGDLRGLAISSSDVLYAAYNYGGAANNDTLYKIDLTNFSALLVGDIGLDGIQALAFDENDVLYGYDVAIGANQGTGLNTIDTFTGAATDLSSSDSATSVQFLAFTPAGQLYGGGASKHYEIDKATGVLDLINSGGYGDIRGADFLPPTVSGLAFWENYGTGVAGTNGEPTLSLTADPVIGTTIKLGSTSSSTTTQVSVIFFGLSDTNIPAPWGGPLLVHPILTIPQTLPATGQGLVLPLPNDIALCGLKVRFQLAQVDPGAMFGVSASKGLLMRLGL